jgi:hypothetical protein
VGPDVDAAEVCVEVAQVDDRRRVLVHVGAHLTKALRELLRVVLLLLAAAATRSEHMVYVPGRDARSYGTAAMADPAAAG